jgi:signal transduction histidine kinase/CheY-like chemotaxis protein/ligand-binding sensor domain-containing protein/HPt (histidine-containing phosphotransfer) domain-containing protein
MSSTHKLGLFLIKSVWVLFAFNVAGVHAQSYRFENYNVNKGLAQSQVYHIAVDRRGFLWMGTTGGGVSIFDGQRFRSMTTEDGLKSNEVFRVMEDRKGTMWMGHEEGGISTYDGRNVKIIRAPGGMKLEGRTVLGMLEDGKIMIGSAGSGLRVFDGMDYKVFTKKDGLPSDSILEILPTSKGAYLATNQGIAHYQNGKITLPNLRGISKSAPISALALDDDGLLLFASLGRLYRVLNDSVSELDAVRGLGAINMIHTDKNGRIWIAGEITLGMLDENVFTSYESDEGLWQTGAYCIAEDNFGNLWVGLDGGGASKLTLDSWEMHGAGSLLGNRAVFALAELEPEHLLIGTERGLFHLKEGVFSLTESPDLQESEIYHIEISHDQQRVYIAGNTGLFLYKNGKSTQLGAKRLRNSKCYMAVEDLDSTVWVATENGILCLDDGNEIEFGKQYPVFAKPTSQIMIDSKGAKWFVFLNKGMMHWEHRKRLETLDLPQNFANNRALTIAEDINGVIWIGTRNGVLRWGEGGCYVTNREGLLGNVIYVLQPDAEGNLWVGTERGMNKLILDHDSQLVDVRTYSEEEGFRGQESNQGASLVDSKGRFWVGTIYGLCRYDPTADVQPDILPRLEMTGLKLNLEDVDWSAMGYEVQPWTNLPINLHLAPDQNHVRFEFKAATMWRAEKVKYKYMLEGLEEQWSKPEENAYATYPALPAGDYTFKVRACDAAGVWTEAVGYSFSVRSPFYRKLWFLGLSLFVTFGVLFLFFRLRLRNANQVREKLERKVKERTEELENANRVKGDFLAKMSHEIRTPMNGVIGMTELLKRSNLDERQRKFVDNIRISGQNLLSLINDILDFSRIESGKMELESLHLEVRALIEEVLDILAYSAYNKGLELMVWVDPEIRGPILGDPSRLKQVILNLVGNAIKFTAEGRIVVEAKLMRRDDENAYIQVSVKDSGIGIPKEKHATLFESFTQVDASTTRKYGGTGLGLAISYNLTKMMGGDMWVESEVGKGTTFHFSFTAGLSGPWKNGLVDHPAREILVKKVGAAVMDPESKAILGKHLEHWGLQLELFASIEELTDKLLSDNNLDFLVIDSRLFPKGISPASTVRHFAELCVRTRKRFALFCEPGQALDVQAMMGENGFLLPKPWKRDDLLSALLGDRRMSLLGNIPLEHDNTLAQTMPIDILIAEDNPINVEVALGMLRNFGYVPRVAEDGEQAVAAVKEKVPDIVFMDVQMPKIDGLQATRLIRAMEGKQPKIVAMTANAMESDRQHCLDAGMDQFISKPFMADELLQMLHWAAGRTLDETRTKEAAKPALPKENPSPAIPAPESAQQGDAPARLLNLDMLEAASGGDPMFVVAILGKMSQKMPEAMLELRASMEKGEWDNVRALAHRTKSSAAYTGADILREKFKEMEHAAMDAGRHHEVPELMLVVEGLVGQIVGEINEFLANN